MATALIGQPNKTAFENSRWVHDEQISKAKGLIWMTFARIEELRSLLLASPLCLVNPDDRKMLRDIEQKQEALVAVLSEGIAGAVVNAENRSPGDKPMRRPLLELRERQVAEKAKEVKEFLLKRPEDVEPVKEKNRMDIKTGESKRHRRSRRKHSNAQARASEYDKPLETHVPLPEERANTCLPTTSIGAASPKADGLEMNAETKPYCMEDFFKYSTKFKSCNKPTKEGKAVGLPKDDEFEDLKYDVAALQMSRFLYDLSLARNQRNSPRSRMNRITDSSSDMRVPPILDLDATPLVTTPEPKPKTPLRTGRRRHTATHSDEPPVLPPRARERSSEHTEDDAELEAWMMKPPTFV